MKLDWDKETGDWRVFDMQDNLLAQARNVAISVPCELFTDGKNGHGWLIVKGKLDQRGNTLFISKEVSDG